MTTKKRDLEELRVMPNIAETLDDMELEEIGALVRSGFDIDKTSRQDWEKKAKDALDLAELKSESKNFPFENSSNVKYPLLTTANIQFAARTYPEIVRNGKVIEVAVIGKDTEGLKEERAKRLSEHMSYQILIENTEWEEHTDRLLHLLPNVGVVFKKTYFDPILGRNASILCLYDEIVVNDNIRSLTEAPRISHLIYKTKNQLVEQVRSGLYLESILDDLEEKDTKELSKEFELIEQHTFLDLDGDGYQEPYIVTVRKETGKVLRIVARFDGDKILRNDKDEIIRIEPVQYFTDFHFIPHPSGRFHSIGFGQMLFPLNSAVNTILNQLIDAGTLANMQGGFISKSVRMKDRDLKLRVGEWKKVNVDSGANLAQNIVPIPYKEPSQVLFGLLGMLIETTKDLSSVTDALTGAQPGQNVPATTMLALVEQGLKVFTSIQRRLYRSFKKEYEKLYRLNRIFLDGEVYFRTMDDESAVKETDYEDDSFDIRPVSDPNLSSDAQRLARTQALLQLLPTGTIDPTETVTRYLKDLDVPNIEKLLVPPSDAPSPEQVEQEQETMKMQADLALRERDLEIRAMDSQVRAAKAEAEITRTLAQATESVAKAEAAEAGKQMEQYKLDLASLKLSFDVMKTDFERVTTEKDKIDEARRNNIEGISAGVEEPSSNPGIVPDIEE